MQRTQKGLPWIMCGVFCLATLATCICTKFIVPEACFHIELIGASPVIVAHKTTKLFKVLQDVLVHSQCEGTSIRKICAKLYIDQFISQ